jgi:hypothetical protein
MGGYTPLPRAIEVGAVLQHRARSSGDSAAPPPIVIVGRDDELRRWLAVDHEWNLVSVYIGVTDGMYRRIRPGSFRHRTTYLAEGRRLWETALARRKVSMRT